MTPVVPEALRDPRAWRLDAALRLVALANPGLPPVGASARVGEDALRLDQAPGLAFPAGEIAGLEPGGPAPRLAQQVIGLLGANGPMPLAVSEHVHERSEQAGDHAPRRFLDVFHHRLASLFHRAWAARAPESAHDRPAEDWFSAQLLALGGARPDPAPAPVDAGCRAALAGLLLARPRGAAGLAALLRLVLQAPVEVDCFRASRVPLDAEDRCRLGRRGPAVRLGAAVIGRSLRSRSDAIRVRLGPLDAAAFARLAPGGEGFRRLRWALRAWLTRPLAVEVAWLVESAAVPRTRLGAALLGRDTWMRLRPDPGPAGQLRAVVPSHAPHPADRPLPPRLRPAPPPPHAPQPRAVP